MEEMIGWPYLYTRKLPNFAFFSHFFIYYFIYMLDHVTSVSHTPITRRRTPKIYQVFPSLSEISLIISIPTENCHYIPTEISPSIPEHIPSTQLSKFLGNRRKTSQSLGDPRIFDLLIG